MRLTAPGRALKVAPMNSVRTLPFRTVSVVTSLVLLGAGCATMMKGWEQPSEHRRAGSTTRRVSPPVRRTLPMGVEAPDLATVRYPGDATRVEAVSDYLIRASGRGASWVSMLELQGEGATPCVVALLPPTVKRSHDAGYLREERDGRGHSDYHVETRTEEVDILFLRELDDLESILKDIAIYTSQHPDTCADSLGLPFTISGHVHGREGIGMRPGTRTLDLVRCGNAGDEANVGTPDVVLLGNIRAIDAADQILPEWMGAHVLLERLDGSTVDGTLTRYVDGVISIHGEGDTWAYVHVMEAKAIALIASAPVEDEPPRDILGAPRAPAAKRDDCGGWRRGDTRTF